MTEEITGWRRMTDAEMERLGWHSRHGANPPAMELANGDVLFPSRDEEGNGPGALFGFNTDGETFMVTGGNGG